MAHPQVGSSAPARLSFAKIAAMPAPNIAPALPNINKNRSSGSTVSHTKTNSQITTSQTLQDTPNSDLKSGVEEISSALQTLSTDQDDHSGQPRTPNGASVDSIGDDQSQLSGSSLKQQSFDTKSMASVTTFAMDEKESIRPDDSASVRAADEDDAHPGLSRNSSFQQETESQVVRNITRPLGPGVTIAARRHPYTTLTNPPRFGDLPVGPVPEPQIPEPRTNVVAANPHNDQDRMRLSGTSVPPDEKLLEALSSHKDRLSLLQLEEKIVAFISTGRDMVLELPPQNSFTRLLTHKLADYYNLAHHINDDNSSVRIFRTDCCILPLSLAEIARSVPVGAQQMSHATQVKIMRRAQLGPRQFSAGNSTAASSSAPSKTTSENGAETNSDEGLQSPIEGVSNKDRSKLTREEREAQYKAARDRIFGDFQESVTSESGSTGEASVSMSRSSSSSGKKKSRKHKVPRDDTFEARSAFVPSYAPMHMHPTYQQVYNDAQYSGGFGGPNYASHMYGGTPASNYVGYDPNVPFNSNVGYGASNAPALSPVDNWQNPHSNAPGGFFNYQNNPAFQPQQVHSQMGNQMSNQMGHQFHSTASTSGIPQSQNWAPGQYQSPYVQSSPTSNGPNWQAYGSGTNSQGPMSYQYGQLPTASHMTGVPFVNQHPLPGSFSNSKSLFNPQTRSFVPGNASARSGVRGVRKKGQTTTTGSARTSGTSSPAISNINDSAQHKAKEDSLQQKYGTPATLPKKPPPSQVSHHFSTDLAGGANNGPLIVNGNTKSST